VKFFFFLGSNERSKMMMTLPLYKRVGEIIVATIALLLLAILPATAITIYTQNGSVYIPGSTGSSRYSTGTSYYRSTTGTKYYYYNPGSGSGTYYPPKTTVPTQPSPAPAPKPAPKPTPVPQPTPPPAPPASGGSTIGMSGQENQMFGLVNQERAKAGLRSFAADMQLVELARKKSKDMIDHNYFGHTSPTYGSPFDMMRKAGVSYFYAGENLAANSSVSGAHQALMNSSGHRANILNPNFTHIGIGILSSSKYPVMVTQMFVGR
jgi:uncharacterized YkwD family protein